MMTPEQIAKKIDWPLEKWPGNCFGIATQMVKAGIVDGKAVYGHYHGFISDDCEMFAHRQFTHHGWIINGDTLIDPTRWVFENVEPYIYEGPVDDEDYDFGGNRVRAMFLRPPPEFDTEHKTYPLPPGEIRAFAQLMLGTEKEIATGPQVMWLANLPLDMLEDMAESVFKWIADDVGIPGFIPYDNRMFILGR